MYKWKMTTCWRMHDEIYCDHVEWSAISQLTSSEIMNWTEGSLRALQLRAFCSRGVLFPALGC